MSFDRRAALDDLYVLLAELQHRHGGYHRLEDANGRMGWPTHGVYFFFEPGEYREDRETLRVTRVGTHALTATSQTTLWDRLRQHRGNVSGKHPGAGNHRGSIFRLHVGTALIHRDGWPEAAPTWGKGSSAPREVRDREVPLEQAVSTYIGPMPFLWLDVPQRDMRDAIERGCIALLSNYDRPAVDAPSAEWLGRLADRPAISRSGLWNVRHVDARPEPQVLDLLRPRL